MTIERDPGLRDVVHVACARVPPSLGPATIARWLQQLPDPRAATLEARLAKGRGIESLTVLALLASLASRCALPSLSRLQWSERGKPRLPGGPDFSLTHSRGFAACAVAPRGVAVGVDLEPEGRARASAIRLVASELEQAALDAGSLSATALWLAKEAVLKAAGAGLADICRVAVAERRARFAGVDYAWRLFRPREGLLLSVATQGRLPPIDIRWPSRAAVFGCASA